MGLASTPFSCSVYFLQCAENTKFLVRASYLEIYNEDVRDLLGADTKQKLEVGADPMRGGQEGQGEMLWFRQFWGSGSCCLSFPGTGIVDIHQFPVRVGPVEFECP